VSGSSEVGGRCQLFAEFVPHWQRFFFSPILGTMKRAKQKPAAAAGLVSGAELDARRHQRLETAGILQRGRTPLAVIEVAQRAADLTASTTEEAKLRELPARPSACAEGCAWCCYKRVGTAVPEVLRIVEYLKQNRSAAELDEVRERVLRLDERRRTMNDAWAAARLPCSLLVGDRCSVYPVRPLTCRGYNSSDARSCERVVKRREHTEVPVYGPQQRLATMVLDGLRAGLTESRLNGDLLELTAALRIALTDPAAFDQWLAGKPVFAPARLV
jgi:Fe-S-cluster containining protein